MKPHICFVALSCYNLLSKRSDIAHIGGAEVQQILMANWLRDQGYQVSFITHDHGQEPGEVIDGIRIFPSYSLDDGLPVLRFFAPRWTKLVDAIREVDADIYYQRAADVETGQTALWCWRNKRRFIFGAANVADCMRGFPLLRSHRERWLYRIGLALADHIVTQTQEQHDCLANEVGYPSTVVRNCGEDPVDMPARETERVQKVLWVGRISTEKRFEWLLGLARACPDVSFSVVGDQNSSSEYGQALIDDAKTLSNVNLLGRLPHDQMEAVYREHEMLCLTSLSEGFPNVFLEAWRVGLPVLTTYDPDDTVSRHGCGWSVSSLESLASTLSGITPEDYTEKSASALRYYRENHTTDHVMSQYVSVLEGQK